MDARAGQPQRHHEPARQGASPLLVGTGKDQVHLLVVMTAERGLCGGFNSNIATPRAPGRAAPRAGRQDGQDPDASAARAPTPCAATLAGRSSTASTSRAIKQLGFANAEDIAGKILALFEAGEFDVATLYFSEFKSVIAQKPTALQLIPAKVPESAASAAAKPRRHARIRAERGGDPRPADRAQHRDAGLPRPAGERRQRAGRAHDRHGQRHAQRRRHDQQADDQVQPPAPGQHHQGTDRDHLGRRGALNGHAKTRTQRKWLPTKSARSAR